MKPAEVNLPSDNEVQVERSFDASAELVWRAFTEPVLVKRWMLGPPGWSMPVCEMNFRVGGEYRWKWRSDEDGKEFGFSGEFRDIERLTKFVHTENYESGDLDDSMGEKGTLVTITFVERDEATTVATLIEYSSSEDRDAALSTGMTDGMEMGYKLLDGVLPNLAVQDW